MSVAEIRALLRIRLLQLAALAGLLVAIGVMALRLKYFVIDSDIW